MATKTNMERAKHYEKFSWIFFVLSLATLTFYEISNPTNTKVGFFLPLIWVAGTGAGVFQAFRALKQEIADLKSGDADVPAATQDSE
jgi:hypothetical protein